MWGGFAGGKGGEEARSFLKKRTKKRLFVCLRRAPRPPAQAAGARTNKVFLLLFLQKKKILASLT